MTESKLSVSKLENGTVIDHIPSGKSLTVLRILGIEPSSRMVVAMNVYSEKYGRKDIIKIEGRYLTEKELDIISLIAPTATIDRIEESEVKGKFKVKLPRVINGVLKCSNLSCITNAEKEPITTKFVEAGGAFQCSYCDSFMKREEIANYLKV